MDYKDLQIPLGRRFRSLKLWFTLRTFGAEGLRQGIRTNINQANQLYDLVSKDGLFETAVPYNFSLLPLCVAHTESNESIELINKRTRHCAKILEEDPTIAVSTAMFKDKFIIRISIGSPQTTSNNITSLYQKLKAAAIDAKNISLD